MFYIFSGIQIDDTGLILALPLKLKHNYILVQFLLPIQEFSENYLQDPPSQPQALRELEVIHEKGRLVF